MSRRLKFRSDLRLQSIKTAKNQNHKLRWKKSEENARKEQRQ